MQKPPLKLLEELWKIFAWGEWGGRISFLRFMPKGTESPGSRWDRLGVAWVEESSAHGRKILLVLFVPGFCSLLFWLQLVAGVEGFTTQPVAGGPTARHHYLGAC